MALHGADAGFIESTVKGALLHFSAPSSGSMDLLGTAMLSQLLSEFSVGLGWAGLKGPSPA